MTDLEGWRTREGFIVAMAMVAMVVGVEEEVAEVMAQISDMKVVMAVVLLEGMKVVAVAEIAKVLVKMLVGGGGLSDDAGSDGGGSGESRNGNSSFK